MIKLHTKLLEPRPGTNFHTSQTPTPLPCKLLTIMSQKPNHGTSLINDINLNQHANKQTHMLYT